VVHDLAIAAAYAPPCIESREDIDAPLVAFGSNIDSVDS